ncbi:hypothetical protein C8R47DRAFT_1153250 [Mycena vitilis]|nr:hypothetical protein C8R47DRAFT_1153250 [Mycena vitilis]
MLLGFLLSASDCWQQSCVPFSRFSTLLVPFSRFPQGFRRLSGDTRSLGSQSWTLFLFLLLSVFLAVSLSPHTFPPTTVSPPSLPQRRIPDPAVDVFISPLRRVSSQGSRFRCGFSFCYRILFPWSLPTPALTRLFRTGARLFPRGLGWIRDVNVLFFSFL